MEDIYFDHINGKGAPPDIFIGSLITSTGIGLIYMGKPNDFYFLASDRDLLKMTSAINNERRKPIEVKKDREDVEFAIAEILSEAENLRAGHIESRSITIKAKKLLNLLN